MVANSDAFWSELRSWRRDFHQHPEFGFEEHRTSVLVAERLKAFGLEVAEGIGGTGVVGTLRRGGGNRSILLRADMDALRIEERPRDDRPHRSQSPGLMHACGHDGHTTMLLGAARLLAEDGGFDGTIRFVFQPAEEWGRGMQAMLDDGLLDRFPADEAYGLHNWPGLAVGNLSTRAGALMAAEDNFEIVFCGEGVHAARPHQGRDALLAAAATVVALQNIVARALDPADAAVVSCTELTSDGARNVIAGSAKISGDCRSFRPDVSTMIERKLREIAAGVASAHGCSVEVSYTREFVPLVNDRAAVDAMIAAAGSALGEGRVSNEETPITASEDFARLLERIPGCFAFLGNGDSKPLHNPAYDFNDEAIPHGVRIFAELARQRLPLPGVVG
jgi:hippurate hydrolase